jgi:hypothetical protein
VGDELEARFSLCSRVIPSFCSVCTGALTGFVKSLYQKARLLEKQMGPSRRSPVRPIAPLKCRIRLLALFKNRGSGKIVLSEKLS